MIDEKHSYYWSIAVFRSLYFEGKEAPASSDDSTKELTILEKI